MDSSPSRILPFLSEMMYLEPLFNLLSSVIEGRVGFRLEDSENVGNAKRLSSKNLKSEQFLGQGLSGYTYETTWSTWFGKRKVCRLARKDFPGVESEVFERDISRLIKLNHPNLAKVFGWTVGRLGCSLVLEFVRNDLHSVVEMRSWPSSTTFDLEPPFELVEAIYIMVHIAKAMAYLHSRGVSHGDLRPNNVLVDLEAVPKTVKVVDFGLTKSKQSTTLVSQRARFLETFDWKAPEIIPRPFYDTLDEFDWEDLEFVQATSIDLEFAADVYSFGITCAYILGARLPFSKDPERILTSLRDNSAGTVRPKLPSTCPAPLAKLIQLSWDSDPERRPPFSQLRNDLISLLQQERTREGVKSSGVEAKRTCPGANRASTKRMVCSASCKTVDRARRRDINTNPELATF